MVGELGGHGDDVALGDTMNRAARIQAAAPDTVVCSSAALRLVSSRYWLTSGFAGNYGYPEGIPERRLE